MIRDELQKRLSLVILIGVIIVLSSWHWIFGLHHWMAVPEQVVAAFDEVKAGEFTRDALFELSSLLGCAFLHGDLSHLVNNLLFLWIFGAVVLEICGWRWVVFIFVSTAIGGSIGQTVLDPTNWIPMLGASGAVMGFEGAYFGLVVKSPRPEPHVWPMAHAIPPMNLEILGVSFVAIDLYYIQEAGFTGVAHRAHVGGFVTGILVSLMKKD